MVLTQTTEKRGDLTLLGHPVAQELLESTIPARLAYIALDGTPRVVPILFHWTGEEIIVSSWADDYKVDAIRANPQVAVTIDTAVVPFRVLSLRCEAIVSIIEGVAPECVPTFTRYFGPEQAKAQVEQMVRAAVPSARIALRPLWVDVIDFETRFPAGMERRMDG